MKQVQALPGLCNRQGVATDQRGRHLLVRLGKDLSERLQGNAHPGSRIGLMELFDIGKAHGFDLIEGQLDFFEFAD